MSAGSYTQTIPLLRSAANYFCLRTASLSPPATEYKAGQLTNESRPIPSSVLETSYKLWLADYWVWPFDVQNVNRLGQCGGKTSSKRELKTTKTALGGESYHLSEIRYRGHL